MIEFPKTEQEVRQLERFLTTTENLPSTPELDGLRADALTHAERLSNTVAIGFVGEYGAGKSSLANMLAGADILPTGPHHLKLPLVIVAFAEEPETTVGWWNKEPKTYAGVALDKAAQDNPDFISVGINTPALRDISLYDLPGSGALDVANRNMLDLLEYLDCAIWCTNGTMAWRESERHLWMQAPKNLKENSVLAVTHADLLTEGNARERVVKRLEKEKGDLFRSVVSIGTPDAVRAMAQEPEPDFDLWASCGGQDLAEQVLALAARQRHMDLEAARSDIETVFLPFLNALATADEPPSDTVEHRPQSEPSLPPIDNPVLEDWLAAIASIRADLADGSDAEPTAFLQSCQEIVEDFAERLDASAETHPDEDWIPGEFEKATDLLLLLQFESGDTPLKDAVNILAQLTDTLAWAGSNVATRSHRTGT